MTGEQRDAKATLLVDDQHRRVGKLILDKGRDGAHRNAAGAHKHKAVRLRKLLAGPVGKGKFGLWQAAAAGKAGA